MGGFGEIDNRIDQAAIAAISDTSLSTNNAALTAGMRRLHDEANALRSDNTALRKDNTVMRTDNTILQSSNRTLQSDNSQ